MAHGIGSGTMVDFEAARRMMVDCQIRPADVTRYALIEAMLTLPRERFLPKARAEIAYADAEIPIADGRMALPPRTLAKMIEVAGIRADDLVLDLAPGLGYSSAVMSRLAAAVVAVESDPAMATQGAALAIELGLDNVIFVEGAPVEGYPAHGPYDVIFINGAVETIPAALVEQLKDGGRLVAIYQQGAAGHCRVLIRAGDAISERRAFDATAPYLPGFTKAPEFAF